MKDFINKINNKEDLNLNEMQEAINLIMCGMSDDDDIESFLIGLNEKGVSETEVTAAATVMKEKSLKYAILRQTDYTKTKVTRTVISSFPKELEGMEF